MKPHGRLKSVFFGVLTDFGGTVLIMLSGIIITPLILSRLNNTSYGFWMTVQQVVGLLGMLEMGAGIAVIQKGADPSVSGDKIKFSRLITSCVVVQAVTATAIFIIGLLLKNQLFTWFKVDEVAVAGSATAYLLMLTWFSLWLLLGMPAILLVSQQRIAWVNGISSFIQLFATIGVVPLLVLGAGVAAFPMAQWGSGLIGVVIAVTLVKLYVPPFEVRFSHFDPASFKQVMGFSLYNWLNKISFMILSASDNILIAATLGPVSVPMFLLSSKLGSLIAPNMSKLSSSAFAAFSELNALKEYAKLQAAALGLLKLSTRVACFGAGIVFCCTSKFVSLWVGSQYFAGFTFVALLSILCFRDTILKSISVIIMASGNIQGLGIISIIEALAKIVLVLFCIKILNLGIEGVILGQLIATLFLSVIYFPKRIAQIVQLPVRKLLSSGVSAPFVQSIPSLFVLALLSRFTPDSWRWFGLFTIVIVSAIVNIACFEVPKVLRDRGENIPLTQRFVLAFRANYL